MFEQTLYKEKFIRQAIHDRDTESLIYLLQDARGRYFHQNTTNVKVKQTKEKHWKIAACYQNTTNVKVKLNTFIAHPRTAKPPNTTNVKVKPQKKGEPIKSCAHP